MLGGLIILDLVEKESSLDSNKLPCGPFTEQMIKETY